MGNLNNKKREILSMMDSEGGWIEFEGETKQDSRTLDSLRKDGYLLRKGREYRLTPKGLKYVTGNVFSWSKYARTGRG